MLFTYVYLCCLVDSNQINVWFHPFLLPSITGQPKTYQVHHHVYRADFVGVHFVQKLLHLLKGWPHGNIVGPAPLDELHK